MPVQANILANMGTFSLSDTIQGAEQTKYLRVRNELLGYESEREAAAAERRRKKKEIEELYAGMPARIEEYERLGMHEEAAQTKDALLNGKRQELAMFEIVATVISAETWDQHRQEAIESGMVEPHEMPVEFSQDWIDKWLGKARGEIDELETTYGEVDPESGEPTGRTMTQERWQRDGNIVQEFPPYEASADRNARTGKGGSGGKPWEFSASDSNALFAQAKLQFDPILDANGEFVGIQGQSERALGQLMERASELLRQAGGPNNRSHAEVLAQAAREQGIPMKQTVGGDPYGWNK